MTTQIEMAYWHPSSTQAKAIYKVIMEEFERIDHSMSRYKPQSELSRINQHAYQEATPVSEELFSLISKSQQVSVLSEGAFDITFASVGHLYDYRNKIQPTSSELAHLRGISYLDIKLDDKHRTIRFLKPGLVIDLGGIAKGYAVDQAISILRQGGIKHARVGAGGDLYLLGNKLDKPWIVAIKDPRSTEQNAVKLPLEDVAMSTSGDYERYFIDSDGQRIHHILKPQNGLPAKGIQSSSVLGPDATTTDALSTAIFVMGAKAGLALINQLPGIDAVIIDENRKLHFSKDLAPPQN